MAEESDYDDFVKEDDSAASDEHEEAKIQEEYAKYEEQRQKWQAQVRAARPWSAPPLSSPRPESQRIKKHETEELARSPAAMLLASKPREEYVPPPRTHLLNPSGEHRPASADMAHLGPPRPASADTPRLRSMLGSTGMVSIKHSGLADIQEESPLTPHHDNGNGHSTTQARAESHHSNEDASSHHTSNSTSPSQQLSPSSPHQSHSPAAGTGPPHSPHSPESADEGASPQHESSPQLEHKHSGICSDDTYSDDEEGHEDLFRLVDQEDQALKNNLQRYQDETAHNQEAQGNESPGPDQDTCEHGSPSQGPLTHPPSAAPSDSSPAPQDTQPVHDSAQASPLHTADTQEAQESLPQAAPQEHQQPTPLLHEPPAHTQQAVQEGGSGSSRGSEVEEGGVGQESSGHEEGDDGAESSGEEEEEETGEGGLLPPHKFALHLMAHDLRTLPAHLGRRSGSPTHPYGDPARRHSCHSSSSPPSRHSPHPPSPDSTTATDAAAAGLLPNPTLPHPAHTYPPGTLNQAPLGTHHTTFPPPGSPPATSHAAYLNTHKAAPLAKQAGEHARTTSPMNGSPRSSTSPTHAAQPSSLEKPWDQWTPSQLRQHLGLSTRPLSAASSKSAGSKSLTTGAAAKRTRPSSATAGGSATLAASPVAGALRRSGGAWSTGGSEGLAAGAHTLHESTPYHHHHHHHGAARAGMHGASEGTQGEFQGLGEGERSRMLGSLGGDSVREEMPSMRTLAVAEPRAGTHTCAQGPAEHSSLCGSGDGQLSTAASAEGAGTFQHVARAQGGGGNSAAAGGGVLKYEDWFARMMGMATGGASAEAPTSSAANAHAVPGAGAGADGTASDPEGHTSASSSPGRSTLSTLQQQEGPLSSPTATAPHFTSSQGPSPPQGRPKERGGHAWQSRPSTAPSSRQAAARVSPYTLQGPPSPHQPYAASPYDASGFTPGLRTEPYVPHRPFSAHARLKGGAYGSPPAQYSQLLNGLELSGAWGVAVPAFQPSPAPAAPQKVDATAAVHVGGAAVSVYVEDTTRRILEANRCMALLELRSRYRLRSRLSNMVVQVYDSTWQPPPPEELEAGWAQGNPQAYDYGERATYTPPTTKELTIKQFLALHMRLKAQAAQAGLNRSLAGSGPSPAAAGGLRRPKSAGYRALPYQHGKPVRQRPMSAQVGASRQSRSGMVSGMAKASNQGKIGGVAAYSAEVPLQQQPLYVSVPCMLQPAGGGSFEWADQGAGGRGKVKSSTQHVQQELDTLAEQCQVLSKNVSLLGGVVC